MRLDDAEALLAVYGDVETMQHLNSELPSTVDEAREWVQTKIDLFECDDQLSVWTVIHSESGQIVGDVGLQHEDYGSGQVVGIGGRGNRQFWRQGWASKLQVRPSTPDSSNWSLRSLVPKPGQRIVRPRHCSPSWACNRPGATPRDGRST